MKGYLITTPTDLARRLADYYGGTVSRPLSQPDICVVMYNGARLAVVSREEDPAGLFLFSGGRGMVKPHGWMFDDALAFVNRVLTVGGEDVPTNFMTDLRRDAARWNAFMNGPEYVRRRVPFIVCASCDNVGNETMVNPLVAAVVPWDVMGDARSFAFVCDKCASGSAVVL
jgi:hypothetical protein